MVMVKRPRTKRLRKPRPSKRKRDDSPPRIGKQPKHESRSGHGKAKPSQALQHSPSKKTLTGSAGRADASEESFFMDVREGRQEFNELM